MVKFELSDSKATQVSLWLTVISTSICILELLHVFYVKGMEIWRCDFFNDRFLIFADNFCKKINRENVFANPLCEFASFSSRRTRQEEIQRAANAASQLAEAQTLARVRFEEAQSLRVQVDEMKKEREAQVDEMRKEREIQVDEMRKERDLRILEVKRECKERITELKAAYKSQLEAMTAVYKDRTLEAETRMDRWKAEQQTEMQKQLEAMASSYKDRAIEADARTDFWITKMETWKSEQQRDMKAFYNQLINKVEGIAAHTTTTKAPVTEGNASIWGRGLFRGSLFRANEPTR